MCSLQTGCPVSLPKVLLKRLSNNEIHHYSSKEKHALNQSQDCRKVKKTKLNLRDKRRKKKVGLTSNVEGDAQLSSTERKSNLRSRNKFNSLKNLIQISRKTSNCSNLEALKKKNENILPPSKTKSNIRNRNTHHSNSNTSVTFKKSYNSITKPISIVKECLPKATRKSSHICVANKINYGVSSIKKFRLRNYRISLNMSSRMANTTPDRQTDMCHNISSRMADTPDTQTDICHNMSSRMIKTPDTQTDICHNMSSRMTNTPDTQTDICHMSPRMTDTPDTQTDACHNNILSLGCQNTVDDPIENTAKETELLQKEPLIQTTVSDEKESESEDDEIMVIGERIGNAMGKILNPLIKIEKCDAKTRRLNRADVISNLIDENKTLSIAVPESQKCEKSCTRSINNDEPEIKSQQSGNAERNRHCGKIKLMSPKSLGIEDTKDEGNDCSTKIMKYEMIKGDTKVANICRTFIMYFNDTIKQLMFSLTKTLEIIILELASDPKLAFLLPTLSKDIELEEAYLESILKKYSTKFIDTFKLIINEFQDEHKSKMIPIVYLLIIKAFDNSNLITEEGVRNCFLRVFEMERFKCRYDAVYTLTWQRAWQMLSIFERWVKSTIDLNIFHVSEKLINNQTVPTLVDETISVSDGRTNIIEESSKEKEERKKATHEKSDQNMDEDYEIICLLENITKTNSDSSVMEEYNKTVNLNAIAKMEPECPSSFYEKDIESLPDCLNQACSKKLTLPCDYCKEPVSCEDLCLVEGDKIMKIIINEDNVTVLVSCRLHQSLVQNYPYDVIEENLLMNRQLHKEDRRKVPQHSQNVLKRENETFVFDMLQDQELPTCLNESCSNKMSISCYYCNEPVACPDLCQIYDDQTIKVRISDHYNTILISCKYHQSLIRNYIYDMESIQVEDCEMPYEPVCWLSDCENRALIVCVCKTRAYCSTTCQKEDWDGEHHKTCGRQPPRDLIL